MSPRSRTYDLPRNKGWGVKSGIEIGHGTIIAHHGQCNDQTGDGDCGPLSIDKWSADGGVINKPDGGFFAAKMYDYVADILNSTSVFPHIGAPDVPSNVAAATNAAARTNPSRPYVDVPVALLELADVASLLRDSGEGLIRAAGSANLKYQFGIAPLASDLAKLMYFQDQVNRRVGEIQRLRGARGLRRTVEIGGYSASQVQTLHCQSNYVSILNRPFIGSTAISMKAHLRWFPDHDVSHLVASQSMRRLATRSVLGLTLDASTAWEAMPWSWMIDWCSTIGDYMKANRNIIPAKLQGVHIMKHSRTQWSTPSYVSGTTTMSGITFVRESKTREPSFISPVAHFPFLSGKQMGIVASLAVTRR